VGHFQLVQAPGRVGSLGEARKGKARPKPPSRKAAGANRGSELLLVWLQLAEIAAAVGAAKARTASPSLSVVLVPGWGLASLLAR
jgi:hypothetical protein